MAIKRILKQRHWRSRSHTDGAVLIESSTAGGGDWDAVVIGVGSLSGGAV